MNNSEPEQKRPWDPLFLQVAEGNMRLSYLTHLYMGQVLEEQGLHHIHYAMLQLVGGRVPYSEIERPVRVSDIARTLGLTPATNTALVDRLEKMELLEREADTEDRRVTRIRLLPKGEALLQHLDDHWNQHAHEVFTGIPREELQVVLQVMERLQHWYLQHTTPQANLHTKEKP